MQTLTVYSNQERGLAGLFGLPPTLSCRLSPWPVPVIISAPIPHAGGPSQHTSPTGIRCLGLRGLRVPCWEQTRSGCLLCVGGRGEGRGHPDC